MRNRDQVTHDPTDPAGLLHCRHIRSRKRTRLKPVDQGRVDRHPWIHSVRVVVTLECIGLGGSLSQGTAQFLDVATFQTDLFQQ